MPEPQADGLPSTERWLREELVKLATEVLEPDLMERAAALGTWARGLVERERRLAEREARLEVRAAALQAAAGVEPVWSLPSEPVAGQIRALILDTGDDVATVARGIGVEAEWAAGVLVGDIGEIDLDHIQRVCEGLHCSPYDLWGVHGGRGVAHAYGPELWPRYLEPLEPPPALGCAADPRDEGLSDLDLGWVDDDGGLENC